jgi:hypothetical protein
MRRSGVLAGGLATLVGLAALLGASPERSGAGRAQGTADLAISWTKTPRSTTIKGGTTVRYVITVKNQGPNAANGITLDVGMVTERAEIFSGAVSDGSRCTKEDVITGLAFFVHCPIGRLGVGASKSATLQLRALPRAGKNGGAILVATLSASSTDTSDPDDSNSFLTYLPGDAIQYSIAAQIGGGKSTAKKLRARLLIAPYGSQSSTVVRYRRVVVFNLPTGANVTLRARGIVESGTTAGTGKLPIRKLVNRSLAVGSTFTVQATKRARIGDFLRIQVIRGGAKLVGRRCIPAGGGAPRASCK